MWQKKLISRVFSVLLGLMLVAPVLAGSINKSINLGDNSENSGQSSVNGSITVGDNSVVNGSLNTVNGSIKVGENTRLKDAETVNGSVKVGSGSTVDDVNSVNGTISVAEMVTVEGEIEVVNGKISLQKGTNVADSVSNVNGEIWLAGAEVGGNVSTVSGDVTLSDAAVLKGDLIVEKPGGWGRKRNKRTPTVIVGPDTRIDGQIVLEQKVDLFISETANIGGVRGEMSLDDAVRFTGDKP